MTLAQNAQVEGELATLREVMRRHMPPDVVMGAIHILEGFPSVVESALLAEWSAGEGLDFEAAYYANVQKIAEDKHQAAIWWRAFVANHHLAGALDALDRQHRARLAAERQKWEAREAELEVKLGRARCYLENLGEFILAEDISCAPLIRAPLVAEVETLRGERDAFCAHVERVEAENTDLDSRLLTAEARVQRLEAALPLARLGLWVLEEQREWRADIYGGDVQDKAVAFGAIAPVTVTEPCDPEHCVCAEFDFPMECFRDTEATKQARALLPEESTK